MTPLPQFPYHRDPLSSGSIRQSESPCECCGKSRGQLYDGVIYSETTVKNLCPWCIADGSAAKKFGASFFDAHFCDDEANEVKMPSTCYKDVFDQTIGFATFNPIGWWVHCNEPAEYIKRIEPYGIVFQCRVCHRQHTLQDLD
ncbi:MAG TPA: hypothetical protein DCP71_12305 [Verrucomicrobiales bacterium]|nr:hypothetical protein [Verrucomicrobiales bacterium]